MRAIHALRAFLAESGIDARKRRLPQFVILGAQRAGTTSLYRSLCSHPLVRPALAKETHFFTLGYRPDGLRYRAWFAREDEFAPGQITGESTPAYLFHPMVAERIRLMAPDVKLIVLLRDPVSRAVSHYYHARANGYESLGLMRAMEAEEDRLAAAFSRHGPAAGTSLYHHSYKSRGRYAEQLERYLARFDRSQLLILKSEDFFKEPARVLQDVCEFLGIRPAVAPLARSTNARTPTHAPIDPVVIEWLARYFAPHNQRLETLLSRDFGWRGPGA